MVLLFFGPHREATEVMAVNFPCFQRHLFCKTITTRNTAFPIPHFTGATWAVQYPFLEPGGPGVRSTVAWAQKANRRRERDGAQSHFWLSDLEKTQRPVETLAQVKEGKGLLLAVTSHMQVCFVNIEITLF